MNQNDSKKKTKEIKKQGANMISLRDITKADEYLGSWNAASEDLLEPE